MIRHTFLHLFFCFIMNWLKDFGWWSTPDIYKYFLFSKTSSTSFAVKRTIGNLPCLCGTGSTPVAYIIQNTPNSEDSALLNVTANNYTRIAAPLLSTVCWSDKSVYEHSCICGNDYADSDTSSRVGSLGLLKSLWPLSPFSKALWHRHHYCLYTYCLLLS